MRSITLPDGRTLSYAEWGDPRGAPVLFMHGLPGSRLWPDLPETSSSQVRLLTVDRPGYGGSDPVPVDRPLTEWAEDVRELADAAGLDAFGVIGWSLGSAHALACARALDDRVTRVAIVGGLLPPAEAAEAGLLSDLERSNRDRAAGDPQGFADELRDSLGWAEESGKDPESFFRSFPEHETWWLRDRSVAEGMFGHIREAYRPGIEGHLWDAVVEHSPWGFRLSDVRVPVDVWHGEADEWVSLDTSKLIAELLPKSRLWTWSEGHLGLLKHWGEVLRPFVARA